MPLACRCRHAVKFHAILPITSQLHRPGLRSFPVDCAPLTSSAGGANVPQEMETILFVDDEPSLRQLGRAILENSGYKVLVAGDGVEAVEVFRKESDRIALVILDLTMP